MRNRILTEAPAAPVAPRPPVGPCSPCPKRDIFSQLVGQASHVHHCFSSLYQTVDTSTQISHILQQAVNNLYSHCLSKVWNKHGGIIRTDIKLYEQHVATVTDNIIAVMSRQHYNNPVTT